MADGPTLWFAEDESDGPKKRPMMAKRTSAHMPDTPRSLSNLHDLILNQLSGDIDKEQYALLLGTLGDIAAIRRRPQGSATDLWAK